MPLKIGRKKRQRRQSFFSDQVINDFSTASCSCELYLPEPSLTFDEFGVVKDVCLSGDSVTLRWSKHCMIHLCEIPDVSPEFPFTLEGTGQDCEICLNVIVKIGDFSYTIRDNYWHEYKYQVGSKWRRFVVQFDDQDQKKFEQYEEKLKEILLEVNDNAEVKRNKLYLLVAVQTIVEKKKSSQSSNRHSRISLSELQQIELKPDPPAALPASNPPAADPLTKDLRITHPLAADSLISSQKSPLEDTNAAHNFLVAPFDPAPFVPADPQRCYADLDEPSVNYDPKLLHSITQLCDSLHIHPRELPHRLESILHSDTGSFESEETVPSPLKDRYKPHCQSVLRTQERERRQTYPLDDYTERLNSEFLLSEELYIPMGRFVAENQNITIKNNMDMMEQAVSNPHLQKVQNVVQSLQTAINNNDEINSQEYAKQLAAQNVIVTIEVKLKQTSAEDKDKEFNLKVHIEDKESSGGIITVKVRTSDTIRDLKNRMLVKHMFPVEVQYWIIGKRIPQDNETLEKCRIKSHGYTAFLYLVSAKSAGINKDEFMRRQSMLLSTEFTTRPTLQTPAPEMSQPPSRLGSSATPGSGATGSASAGKPKLEPRALEDNLNILVKDEKRTPEKLQVQWVRERSNENRANQSGAEIRHVMEQIVPHIGHEGAKGPSLDNLLTLFNESRQRVPVMHPEENEEPQQGWSCPVCTYINQPTRPGCELCSSDRPAGYEIPADYVVTDEEKKRLEIEAVIDRQTREAEARERLVHQQEIQQNYEYLQETEALNIIPNMDEFTCPICLEDISSGDGVLLRECLHSFCKVCLHDAVQYNEEAVLKCPFMDDDYTCDGILHDREVKALVSPAGFAKYLARSLATAESQAQNSFHCKTADCPGWCIYEDHVNFFVCQVCGKENCLTCKSIHQGMNCKQYQEDLKMRAVVDKAANQTQLMVKKMLDDGDAINCPQCHIIVMKKDGCDWIQCSICKVEICWVRKMARWGPMGNGDISGGCKCRVNGIICDPNCNNCH